MQDKDIMSLWKKGISKNKLALIYKSQYNQQIKILRSTIRHRHDGKFISNYEALAKVEKVIYRYINNKRR